MDHNKYFTICSFIGNLMSDSGHNRTLGWPRHTPYSAVMHVIDLGVEPRTLASAAQTPLNHAGFLHYMFFFSILPFLIFALLDASSFRPLYYYSRISHVISQLWISVHSRYTSSSFTFVIFMSVSF